MFGSQEDGDDAILSVFNLFCELFPEVAAIRGIVSIFCILAMTFYTVYLTGKNKRLRLHFNKIGYQLYGKEQSRRVRDRARDLISILQSIPVAFVEIPRGTIT